MNYNPEVNPESKEVTFKINEIKNNLVAANKPFSKEEFKSALKKIGLPKSGNYWSALANCRCSEYGAKLITLVGKGKWVFTNPKKPICWKDLQEIYNFYSKIHKEYNSTYYRKRKAKKESPVEVVPVEKTSEESLQSMIDDIVNYCRRNNIEVNIQIAIK